MRKVPRGCYPRQTAACQARRAALPTHINCASLRCCPPIRPSQGNRAASGGYGPIVASSPCALAAPKLVPFYDSVADMALSVDVLDCYGQLATGEG